MKHKIFLLTLLLLVAVALLLGGTKPQSSGDKMPLTTIVHPLWTVDCGGGKSAGGILTLQASIGQPAAQAMTATGFNLESGYMPGMRQYAGARVTMSYTVSQSWNLLSIPLLVSDYRKATLYPAATSKAFMYESGYKEKDTLKNGIGFWVKYPSSQSVLYTGTTMTSDTIDVNNRWNIIGALSYPILKTAVVPIAPVTISSVFWGYASGTGYASQDTLKPGKGYWLKVSQAGKLFLRSGSLLIEPKQPIIAANNQMSTSSINPMKTIEENKFNMLNITDAEGKDRTLYYSAQPAEIDMDQFEMPPVPNTDIFDIRFTSSRFAEMVDTKSDKKMQEFPIHLQGVQYPLTLSWDIQSEKGGYMLNVVYAGKRPIERTMTGKGEMTITQSNVASVSLIMTAAAVKELPKEFALSQNYPNPFNPSTIIRYDLPIDAKVTLKMYNVLGQEVRTVVDEIQEAGYKSVNFNASDMASGVYFYRIDAVGKNDAKKTFNQVKKMMLVK
jgi:hypothetical protein